ncbi:hypothetical protein [Kitasatospora sp. NPDC091276]|uniref:hypothetical protein n=1 Tax=unclassified Kitasatospora TaxID=2633591 RepID=UPI003425326B
MEAVLVRADRRSAGCADPAFVVESGPPGDDLAPVLPPGGCSSSRHAEHDLAVSRPPQVSVKLGPATDRNGLTSHFAKSAPEPLI